MGWDALSPDELTRRVFEALERNHSYRRDTVLGLPGSFLDRSVFPPLPEMVRYPWLATLIDNPNHIGCHTLGVSEPSFAGTHALEREVVSICAEALLHAATDSVDGYIASGGTESNIQAMWTFRNALRARGVERGQIGILYSSDTHYSFPKAADLLDLPSFVVPVDDSSRRMLEPDVRQVALRALREGITHMLVILNMGTTMFGSVDDVDDVLPTLDALGLVSLVHVDAAFGGFIYPLTGANTLDFRDPRLLSITLDAHKMLQAPYGTGIHLIRKGWIQNVLSKEAAYVPGLDSTLSGSRSGSNAVAVWMILMTYGRSGGEAFCRELMERTVRLCEGLQARNIRFFRHADMNVVTIRAEDLQPEVAERFQLVPDDHHHPRWYKIVVMDHVTDAQVDSFLAALPAAV